MCLHESPRSRMGSRNREQECNTVYKAGSKVFLHSHLRKNIPRTRNMTPGPKIWKMDIQNFKWCKNFDSPKYILIAHNEHWQYKLFFSPTSNIPSDSSHVVPSYRFVKTSSINQQRRRESLTSSVVTSVEQVTSWQCLPTHLGFSSHVYTNFSSLKLFISVV